MHSFFEMSAGAKILLAICAAVLVAEGLYINYIMGSSVFSMFAEKTSCERVLEKWEAENPELAKDRPLYEGPIATVDYTNTNITQAANFKTAIDEAVAAGPNFAGKYAVAQWGCGTNCQGHAVVNVESGKIIAFGPQTEAGLGILETSPVMITNPKENFPSIADMQKADLPTLTSLANIPREYYVLVGDDDSNVGLQKICTENPFEGVRI
ncbi:MAG: hypothetical protein WA021_01845 [Minisyncoccia bacterium]